MSWKIHPAAELFPMIDTEELNALADDINANGLIDPIVIYKGQVLDGRNRLAACERAGVEPRVIHTTLMDGQIGPTEWVLSKNLHRRQLTKSQAAAVAVEAEALFAIEAKARMAEAGASAAPGRPAQKGTEIIPEVSAQPAESRELAGELLGVNPRYVSDAKKLRDEAPETYERVKAGKLNIQQAKREAVIEQAQRDPWTERDNELKAALEVGRTVVLNASSDGRVIGWAQPKGLIVFVDRTSPWGNPFVHNADGDRDEVCEAYAQHYLPNKPSLQAKLGGLSGKGLVCHCAPLRCHADALKEIVG
jgi:ParB-like chromosome segregation protein Spo0J